MKTKISWKEFQESGLLWVVNHVLHIFGHSIVIEVDTETGEITDTYPARTSWRGFVEGSTGYEKLTKTMISDSKDWLSDFKDKDEERIY